MNLNLTKGLTVLKKNGLCSIQDLGRMSSQHLGFSASGAADEYAYLFANYLLETARNSQTSDQNGVQSRVQKSAALEITLGQVTLKAEQNCTIAITGADCSACINDKRIKNWQAHQIKSDDIISFTLPKNGLHTYLAIAGGIQSKQWLNSQTQTLTESALGFSADAIKVGSNIPLAANATINLNKVTTANMSALKLLTPSAFYTSANTLPNKPLTLRFIPQSLYLKLDEKHQKALCDHTFTISSQSNKMGYRLSALPNRIITQTPVLTKNTNSKLSKPVTYGTIQLPSNSQPIVLMKERQTIGGYPTLGCVIQTDLFKLSQLRPGNKVQFIPTTLAFAQQQLSAMYQRFK